MRKPNKTPDNRSKSTRRCHLLLPGLRKTFSVSFSDILSSFYESIMGLVQKLCSFITGKRELRSVTDKWRREKTIRSILGRQSDWIDELSLSGKCMGPITASFEHRWHSRVVQHVWKNVVRRAGEHWRWKYRPRFFNKPWFVLRSCAAFSCSWIFTPTSVEKIKRRRTKQKIQA